MLANSTFIIKFVDYRKGSHKQPYFFFSKSPYGITVYVILQYNINKKVIII